MTASSTTQTPTRFDLESVYQRARIWAGLAAAFGLSTVGLVLRWPPAAVIATLSLGVAGHGWYRLRHPATSALGSLVVDTSVVALGLLVARPPGLVAVPPLAYLVVITPLLLKESRAAWVVLFAILATGASLFAIDGWGPPSWGLGETLLVVALSAGLRAHSTSFAMGTGSSMTRTSVVPSAIPGASGSSAARPVGRQQARPIARSCFMAISLRQTMMAAAPKRESRTEWERS